MSSIRAAGLIALAPFVLFPQTPSPGRAAKTIEIQMERNENGSWRTIDPGLILNAGDRIRFRFHTTFTGYLYVLNSGTSGTQSLLFPADATGRNNRVEPGKDYFVPATGAWFKVAGPPGQDIMYWLVSPVALGGNPAAALADEERRPSPQLMPRCDDAVFRARGLCIDSSAGPQNLSDDEPIPKAISPPSHAAARELIIVQNQDKARISSPNFGSGPAIYEFRLAHR